MARHLNMTAGESLRRLLLVFGHPRPLAFKYSEPGSLWGALALHPVSWLSSHRLPF